MSTSHHPLAGVYAAAVTPITEDFSVIPEEIPKLLAFLAQRKCDGALLMGTTGEGPSLALEERQKVLHAGVHVREVHPDFRLLAGTGTPSLDDTISLTRLAFDIGYDGVVVLPPYYYRQASQSGLHSWFHNLLQNAVPDYGALFGYHIPAVSGVPLHTDLLLRLRDKFPTRLRGVKDSSGDPEHTRQLCEALDNDFLVMVGNDRWFAQGLVDGAAGCITALANLISPELGQVWQAWEANTPNLIAEKQLDNWRTALDRNQPAPPYLKLLLSKLHDFPLWFPMPPLTALSEDLADGLATEFLSINHGPNA